MKKLKGLDLIKNPFWKAVLKAWIEKNTFDDKITFNDTLYNNENITINNNVFFVENAIRNNILLLKDFFEDEQIITFEKYEEKIGRDPTNMIDYVRLKASVNKIKHKIIHQTSEQIYFRETDIENTNRKQIYHTILKDETCFCEKMWENRLGKKLHSNTWNNILIGLKETKLREVQWKIVHNIYPTNILLNKMGIKSSEKCDFCDEVDVVEHMFFRCKRLQTFWTDVSKRIDNRVKKNN